MTGSALRQALREMRRVVVKVGTRVLVQRSGRPDNRRIAALAEQIARVHRRGREVVLVSSGAIGAGMQAMGMRSRPTALPELQMAAAVGQSRLMTRYDQLFDLLGCTVGQVLLTHDDLRHRVRHLNARNTMTHLLSHRIIPIVNENDAVSVDEIKFGDNDHLASLVTMLVDAELLVLLSTTNGLRAPAGPNRTRRIAHLPQVTEETLGLTWGKASPLSSGGMFSKLQAAQAAADVGALVVIADGRKPDVLERLLDGEDVGTLIGTTRRSETRSRSLPSRKRWIAFFQRPQGALVVDDGARAALQANGKSLLPIGIRAVEGQFEIGAVVDVTVTDGTAIARGLVEFSSQELAKIKGHRTSEIEKLLGSRPCEEVIHRDNMVVFEDPHHT